MSQNNDQGRQGPSQSWYDNGQAPKSKKFPFGAGSSESAPDTETRNHWQVEAAQYGAGGGAGDPQATGQGHTPPYGQQAVNDAPQAPQYGAPDGGQQFGGSGRGRHAEHPTDETSAQGHDEYQSQQSAGSGPQQPYGDQGGSGQHQEQPGQYQQQQGQSQQQGQPDQGQHQQQPQGQSQQNQQAFQGILDPHTGEIHPVPDLDGLQETDALLVVVSGPDSGSQILLDTDVVTVGRSPNADIFLDDVTVSRKHAEFIRTPSGFTLRDTGSLNGTYVGRQLIDSIELHNGADVQIGKFRMIFQQRPRS